MEELTRAFEQIGLSTEKAQETARNKKLGPQLRSVIDEAGVGGCAWSTGALLYDVASLLLKEDAAVQSHRSLLARNVALGHLRSSAQIVAAIAFLRNHHNNNNHTSSDDTIDIDALHSACGVGVDVAEDECRKTVDQLADTIDDLLSLRYKALPLLLKAIRDHPRLKWADGKMAKATVDAVLLHRLGPKDERDAPPPKKKKDENVAHVEKTPASTSSILLPDFKVDPFYIQGELARLHKPGGNKQINPALMDLHLKATAGKVQTRFPPEPNGYLHIGHAKAININFGYARAHGGTCNLRYDDTNPEAEEERYFTSILDSVRWLGFEPDQITYASDHFQKLYELAVDLIKRDKAYVCHCTAEEIQAQRGGDQRGARYDSPWRNRPIEESLREFEKMKNGYYKENEAVLRMKMDMQSPNPQFWDLVAYRILYTPHYRTADSWCIYPLYDFVHCLCDSFENITHSMCTSEFRNSRESYYWLCDALEVYKPVQWEYGRLNITKTVLSKRKLHKLVEEKYVSGWDDPRLFTLVALKRRGVPPLAINRFIREGGVTTAQTTIDIRRLEWHMRQVLDDVAPRVMAVLRPLEIRLINLPSSHYETISIPYFPKQKYTQLTENKELMKYLSVSTPLEGEMTRVVPFSATVFIDRSDFSSTHDPNFYRLTEGGVVGLLNVPFPIQCVHVVKTSSGDISHLECLYLDPTFLTPAHQETIQRLGGPKKVKSYIQWVSDTSSSTSSNGGGQVIKSPLKATVRVYGDLFHHDNPADNPNGWLADVNKDSLEVIENVYLEPSVTTLMKVGDVAQFVRSGYFCVDTDSKNDAVVFNLTVGLKEDPGKN